MLETSQTPIKCAYCDQEKLTREWKETNEEVCYDCRLDFLDREFQLSEKDELRNRYGI